MDKKRKPIFSKILLRVLLTGLLIWTSLHVQGKIEVYQLEVERLQLEIEQLRLEQQELTKQVKSFLDKWNIAVMEATAYAPADNKSGLCADSNPLLTATGVKPGPGVIAVNPKAIPYHSEMWVQGYGWGQALDTGAAMRKRVDLIDLYADTYEEAIRWGRRKVVVVWSAEPIGY